MDNLNQAASLSPDLGYIMFWLGIPSYHVSHNVLRMCSVLGDSVSVAILRAIYPHQLVDDVRLKKILAALDAAFDNVEMIRDPSDRIPAVTTCLLRLLLRHAESRGQQNDIKEAVKILRKRFGEMVGEPGQ